MTLKTQLLIQTKNETLYNDETPHRFWQKSFTVMPKVANAFATNITKIVLTRYQCWHLNCSKFISLRELTVLDRVLTGLEAIKQMGWKRKGTGDKVTPTFGTKWCQQTKPKPGSNWQNTKPLLLCTFVFCCSEKKLDCCCRNNDSNSLRNHSNSRCNKHPPVSVLHLSSGSYLWAGVSISWWRADRCEGEPPDKLRWICKITTAYKVPVTYCMYVSLFLFTYFALCYVTNIA